MKVTKPKIFFGGIRLSGRKERTQGAAITPLAPVDEVRVFLKQHIGAPALPCVRAGEHVKRGQPIATAQGGISANVHAPVAGEVLEVVPGENGQGHIAIRRSELQETAYMPPLNMLTGEKIRERIFQAGIVGMGGAGFPTHVKLNPSKPVDTLILNGAECEPYLTCDDAVMREQSQKIARGGGYLAAALGVRKIMIGIEKNKPQAISLFRATVLTTIALPKRYPAGSEKHLIYACTGRKVPCGGLPADAGAIVQNVATALAVAEAVEDGKPLIERVVTVSGGGVNAPKNLLCPIGAPFRSLLEACSPTQTGVKLLDGGPMTGTALESDTAWVKKTTSGVTFLTERETDAKSPTPCINCGKCAEVCPMRLLPMQIEFYTAAKEYDNAERYGGVLSCIACGACSYICPARRPLSQAIRTARENLGRRA